MDKQTEQHVHSSLKLFKYNANANGIEFWRAMYICTYPSAFVVPKLEWRKLICHRHTFQLHKLQTFMKQNILKLHIHTLTVFMRICAYTVTSLSCRHYFPIHIISSVLLLLLLLLLVFIRSVWFWFGACGCVWCLAPKYTVIVCSPFNWKLMR